MLDLLFKSQFYKWMSPITAKHKKNYPTTSNIDSLCIDLIIKYLRRHENWLPAALELLCTLNKLHYNITYKLK